MSFRDTVRDSLIAPLDYDEAGMTGDSSEIGSAGKWLILSAVLVVVSAGAALGMAVFG